MAKLCQRRFRLQKLAAHSGHLTLLREVHNYSGNQSYPVPCPRCLDPRLQAQLSRFGGFSPGHFFKTVKVIGSFVRLEKPNGRKIELHVYLYSCIPFGPNFIVVDPNPNVTPDARSLWRKGRKTFNTHMMPLIFFFSTLPCPHLAR